jgi:Fur family ferric uptake transcriptional regulator
MAVAGTGPAERSTRQRTAVAALMDDVAEFRSAQEVYELLRRRGERIGLTTVYRSLQILASAGTVDVLREPDGETSYRRCSQGHHHHLVCRTCGRTVEFDLPGVERHAETVARENGFTDVSHTLEVFGTCATCASA